MFTDDHVYLGLFVETDNAYPIVGIDYIVLFNPILRNTKCFPKFLTFSLELLFDIFLYLLFSSLVLFFHCFNILPSNNLNQLSSFRDEFHQNLGFFVSYSFSSGDILLPYSISFFKLSLVDILLLGLNYFFILLHVFLTIVF